MYPDPLGICADQNSLSLNPAEQSVIPFTISNLLGTRCERIIDPGFFITSEDEGKTTEYIRNGQVKMTTASTETGKGTSRVVSSLVKFEGTAYDSAGVARPITVQLTVRRPSRLDYGTATTNDLTMAMMTLLRAFMTPANIAAVKDRQL